MGPYWPHFQLKVRDSMTSSLQTHRLHLYLGQDLMEQLSGKEHEAEILLTALYASSPGVSTERSPNDLPKIEIAYS